MTKKIGLEIDVKSDSVASAKGKVESATQELRRLKRELASGELKGEAFEAASKRAGELQDNISDVSKRVRNLASDTRQLDTLVSAAQGIAGGFAVAQGAAALFGSENEELQKTFVKLQATMTALNGLQAVANTLNKDSVFMTNLSAKAMRAKAMATNMGTTALGKFKLALIATGLGALVVILASVIANWEKLKTAINGAAGQAKNFADSQRELAQESRDVLDNFDEQARTLRRLGFEESEIELQRQQAYEQAIKRTIGSIEANKIAVKEAEKALEKVAKWEKFGFGLIPRLIYGDEEDLKQRKKELDDSLKDLEKLLNDKFDFESAIEKREERRKKMEEENDKKQREDTKKQREKEREEEMAAEFANMERRAQLIQDQNERELKLLELKHMKERLAAEKAKEDLALLARVQQKEMEELEENHLKELDRLKDEARAKEKQKRTEHTNQLIANADYEMKKQAEIDQINHENKMRFQQAGIDMLAGLSALMEDNSKAQKAVALASIAADTATAIGRAIANSQAPTPDNVATGGLAGLAKYATIFASITQAAARAKQVMKSSAIVVPSSGSVGTVQKIQTPTLQQTTQGIELRDQRVYVLESDISRTQRRVRTLEGRSVID